MPDPDNRLARLGKFAQEKLPPGWRSTRPLRVSAPSEACDRFEAMGALERGQLVREALERQDADRKED